MIAVVNLLALSLLIIGAPVGLSDSVSVQIVERMQRSTVPILCITLDEKNEIKTRVTLGTGFFINRNGDILTAAHVVVDLIKLTAQQTPCFGIIYAAKTEWKTRYTGDGNVNLKWFQIGPCHYREDVDIGVCKARVNPFLEASVNKFIQPVSLASFTKYNDGSAVAFTGFPLQSLFPITSKGDVASYDPGTKRLLIDRAAWPGASGSPVYTSDGKVIALIIATGTEKSAGLSIARPTDFALDMLRERKILTEK